MRRGICVAGGLLCALVCGPLGGGEPPANAPEGGSVVTPPVTPPSQRGEPGADGTYAVGVAKVDITPDYPIRLNGFGGRREESEGVRQRIWAKALAIGSDEEGPAVLIAVDTLGVPDSLVERLAGRLKEKAGIRRERLAATATHTHTGPMIRDVSPTIFGVPIPPQHQAHIDRYSAELEAKLEDVALAALEARRPARVAWGLGSVGFAANRRTKGGPVDHDLPLLVVQDVDGKPRALWVSYACHCVTLSDNKIGGDWAGYAQEIIEREHPECIAMVSIGCGADANPDSGVTGDRADIAEAQGRQIAVEVERLLAGALRPLSGELRAQLERIELPLAALPTRAEWEERAKDKSAVGHHARVQLARLDRGEALMTKISYPIQSWAFGDRLAMVFLPGEVVVDYAKRLKRELDGRRLWINAYANACPGYVPSERILKEGGYEGGGAMVYYDIPVPYAPGLEQKIVDVVRKQVAEKFAPPATTPFQGVPPSQGVPPGRTGGSLPLSPQESLAALRPRDGMVVELAAAEPLVASPVAIDFGPDGRLWVAEMYDYPSGTDGNFTPGGRIKVLEDADGDGRYDRATTFLDGIPFPTGVTVWRDGVLVCAAPDILYAEDNNGDGKADIVRKLFSGFATHNYQARVNSLEYGLDGWVYGACGLFGGEIRSFPPPLPSPTGGEGKGGGPPLHLSGRDFRMNPDTGAIEPASGNTQQGRVRDDWGNGFGCDNSTLVRHYPLADHYLRRNPHVAPPDPAVYVPDYPESNRLYPAGPTVLFKLSGPANRVTAACGLGVYRDELLGPECTGNTFTCEPVNNVVHRLVLSPRGVTFSGRRAEDEAQSEFLASTDPWFRPVQARTGPDGALWVVDMYRYVIEHPRWIPPETLTQVDVRAGAEMGRIYRVYPRGQEPRKPPRLDRLETAGLVAALDSPNGWQRDMAQQMLLWKRDAAAAAGLEKLAAESRRPETRLHALCTLDGLGGLTPGLVARALADEHPGVRRHAVRLAEGWAAKSADVADAVLERVDDPDPQVQLQLACSLGEWNDARAAAGLAHLALRHHGDAYLTAGVLSSLNKGNVEHVLAAILSTNDAAGPPVRLLEPLLAVSAALGDDAALRGALGAISSPGDDRNQPFARWQIAGLTALLDGVHRRESGVEGLLDATTRPGVEKMLAQAAAVAVRADASEEERVAAVRLLGRAGLDQGGDLARLAELLVPWNPPALQAAVVEALGRTSRADVPALLLAGWEGHSPQLRSQILDVLMSRVAWLEGLLDAVAGEQVSASQFELARRDRILRHPDERIRRRAGELFGAVAGADRQQVLKDYAAALSQPGDPGRGKEVFAKHCAACHRLDGTGVNLGPDLVPYAGKAPQAMLVAVLDPNQAVDPRYLTYVATLADGRVLSGIVSAETGTSITLDASEGKRQVILRGDLEEIQNTGKSLMPEGFERELAPQDVADLVAFVAAQGVPPKMVAGNKPAVVRPAADGSIHLPASKAEIYGGDITFETEFGNIGYWHGAQDRVVWTVAVESERRYDVYLDWACHSDSAGNAFVLEVAQEAVRGVVASTGDWSRYEQRRVGSLTLPAGVHRLIVRPDGAQLRGALFDLRAVRLVPSEKTDS